MVPFTLSFEYEEPGTLQWMTRLFWTFECVMSFNTSYYHAGPLALGEMKTKAVDNLSVDCFAF